MVVAEQLAPATQTGSAHPLYVREVSKRYGGTVLAVDRLSLTIPPGEFLVLVGPSGCGKTTALRMIAGLETVDSGDIVLGERSFIDLPPKERDIAMVFQSYALYPHMSVRENLAFPLKMRGIPKHAITERIAEIAKLLEIDMLLDRKPKQLSGGQRQRVALGRAVVRRPQVFLMDEPLSNLDAELRVRTRSELVRLQRQLGVTTVYVTHDQVEAMTMGHRIAVMNHGVLQQVGSPLDLYRRPANVFVATFIGSPAMNIFPATRTDDGSALWLGERAPARVPVAQAGLSPVLAGFRPEDLLLRPAHDAMEHDFVAKVDHLEQLGNETIVYLSREDIAVVARVSGDAGLNIGLGSLVRISVDPDRIHLFDPATTHRISA